MSIEILATMITGLGLVVTLGSSMFVGFAWMLRRIDGVEARLSHRIDDVEEKLSRRIDDVEEKLSRRIDDVEEKLSHRIDGVEEKLSRRIDDVQAELVDVKVSVARWEGPRPQLQTRR
nr:hypothetical protein [Microbacterium resistens]